MDRRNGFVRFLFGIACFLGVLESIPIDNDVEGVPEIACLAESAKIAVQTAKPFHGHIYVKGQFRVDGCHLDLTGANDQSLNLQAARPTIIYEIPYRGCVVKRERTANPPGLSFTMSVVVQFHHQFLTKVDRAYRITCFYMEATKSVTVGLDVSMLETTQLYQTRPMPICTYDVLRGGLNGPIMRFAQVGEMAFHKWSCQGATGIYGILVHSCAAADGTGEEYRLIDNRGCAIDPVIVNDITYTPDLTMAYVEVHVFKFADKMQISIQCQVSLCLLNDGGCDGITPPTCPVHNHERSPAFRLAQPPAGQLGSPPSASPPLSRPQEPARTIVTASYYSAPASAAVPPSVVFPTPPPTGLYLRNERQRSKRYAANKDNSTREIRIIKASEMQEHEERSGRFARTIDLASDDMFVFNMDDQMPIDGDPSGLTRHSSNRTIVGLSRSSGGTDSSFTSANTCTSTMGLIMSLLGLASLLISLAAVLILYQRRYYLGKLGSAACALRSNGLMT